MAHLSKLLEIIPHTPEENNQFDELSPDSRPFRFFTEKNCVVLAMADRILMIESNDHFVKVLIREGDGMRWVIRHGSMKELLVQLPQHMFARFNRFYAINIRCTIIYDNEEQTLQFDREQTVKLNHAIDPSCFRKVAR